MKIILKMHARALLSIVAISLIIACTSNEQQYIKELCNFTEYVNTNSVNFSDYEWDTTLEGYNILRQQKEEYAYQFSPRESAEIDSCYRVLNATMAKSFIKINTNKAEGFLNEFKNLLEDIITE